jgi:hypothetical protein
MEMTGGIPVSIVVYPKPQSEYMNKIFSGKKAIVEIEVRA